MAPALVENLIEHRVQTALSKLIALYNNGTLSPDLACQTIAGMAALRSLLADLKRQAQL